MCMRVHDALLVHDLPQRTRERVHRPKRRRQRTREDDGYGPIYRAGNSMHGILGCPGESGRT